MAKSVARLRLGAAVDHADDPHARPVTQTILTLVLFATYLGIGALAHDSHFSLLWALCSTLFVWAGPA